MKIERNLSQYCISGNTTVLETMRLLTSSHVGTLFVVDNGYLKGSVTDGDIRRFIISGGEGVLHESIQHAMNPKCISLEDGKRLPPDTFRDGVDVVPVVSDAGALVSVILDEPPSFEIDGIRISRYSAPYVIAEIGINHQGSIDMARELVDAAKASGAQCAKFQMRDMENLYSNKDENDPSGDLGTQYTLGILNKFNLTHDEMFEIFDYCKSLGISPLCTPWDSGSLARLEEYGMPGYKVASADFTNFPFLEELCATRKPLILSTGMSTQAEISKTVEFLNKKANAFALLHCNSTYPTPYKHVNLSYMHTLGELVGKDSIIGYSGHERGWVVPCAAVALGARIVEKHLTLDKGLEGNDHKVSLLPLEFKTMVTEIENTYESLGESGPRELSQGEMINRQTLSKSIVAKVPLSKGEVVKREHLTTQSPGNGLQPIDMDKLIGVKLRRDVGAGKPFFEGDLRPELFRKDRYDFARPYGIPVRYHDYRDLTSISKLDFAEFHMSWRDLDLPISDYVDKTEELDFAVHAPDLFANDHIMDLGSSNSGHVDRSIAELKKVVEVSNNLKVFFPKTAKPVVVTNVGGWSKESFMDDEAREQMIDSIEASLATVDFEGVELAIQTMPPFPWHFGGQGYCNFFTHADQIKAFCEKTGYKVCLDVSHSLMSSNYFGFDLVEFIETVGPYVVHIHISDAKGVDGEGVEFGMGDLDLPEIGKALDEHCAKVQFLPEIWQGHNNEGYGFWSALNKLENHL